VGGLAAFPFFLFFFFFCFSSFQGGPRRWPGSRPRPRGRTTRLFFFFFFFPPQPAPRSRAVPYLLEDPRLSCNSCSPPDLLDSLSPVFFFFFFFFPFSLLTSCVRYLTHPNSLSNRNTWVPDRSMVTTSFPLFLFFFSLSFLPSFFSSLTQRGRSPTPRAWRNGGMAQQAVEEREQAALLLPLLSSLFPTPLTSFLFMKPIDGPNHVF